jgi:hypothetical protein
MRGWLGTLTLFVVASAGVATWYGRPFLDERGAARLRHLPAELSDGHAQIDMACDACHTPFGGVGNEACQRCHEDGLAASQDAHPESKFTDPRNADRLANLDARRCVTCHQEHLPERTSRAGVTLPVDFCRACHEDIAKDRPSHDGLAFTTCSATGCHNFHDNRALNESFLAKHLGEPRLVASPRVPTRTPAVPRPPPAAAALDEAPPELADAAVKAAWAGSAHARGQVGCRDCHAPGGDGAPWAREPSLTTCRDCHEEQGAGFDAGKHGMREAAGLPAMTPALARRPMKADAHPRTLGCVSCHDAHTVDVRRAAVEACGECHDDAHTRAYAGTPHARAWEAELAGAAPPGSGVSCATCHLPRDNHDGRTRVQHDQNANLRPTTKMVRTVCGHCHGVGYALDALADAALVERNFDIPPAARIATTEWVERRVLEKAARQRQREEKRR